jgi:signal peptidase I
MDDTPLRRRLGLDRAEASAEAPAQWEHDEVEDVRPPAANVRGVVRELLETAIFILLVFFIVRGIVQNFKIEGQSMEPNLHGNQYILVNKLVYFHFDINAPLRLLPGNGELPARPLYLFSSPHRGDVVVFEYPRDVSKDYIKRVIGMEGDQVQVRDGKVFVNGVELDEEYMHGKPTSCESPNPCANGTVVTVSKGTIFVMGDNRDNSSDSREWGALPLDRVIGKAAVIYYPLSDWGLIPSATYDATP